MVESRHEKTQLQMKFEPRENSWFHRHSDMSWPAKFACKTAVRSTAELIANFFLHFSLPLCCSTLSAAILVLTFCQTLPFPDAI